MSKLELINFIQKNPNTWEEKLSRQPYKLTIKRKSNFILFYYNQFKSDFNEKLVRESRGIILEDKTFKVLAYPFDKFFNYGENLAVNIDWNSAKVLEKIDGSLIKIWNYKNKWMVSTMQTIDAKDASLPINPHFSNYYDLFMSVARKKIDFSRLNKNYTYIFELISPYNRVVVDYPSPDIYHIGTRNNKTLKEIEVDIGVKKPRQYSFESLKDVINMAKNLPLDKEGYVVVDKYYNRVKIKSPAYVVAHHLRNDIGGNKILELVLSNEQDEFLVYFPEYKEDIKKVEDKLNVLINKIDKDIEKAKGKRKLNRKEYAEWAKKQEYPAILFQYYDGKKVSGEDYVRSLPVKKIKKMLNLF